MYSPDPAARCRTSERTHFSSCLAPSPPTDQRRTIQPIADVLKRISGTWIRSLCAIALCLCVISGVSTSRHWPLVGDSTLMHYVVFLQSKGAIPYKDIFDINLPGTYLFEALSIRIFGYGAAGWRFYDFTLLAAVIGACVALAGWKRWFGGVFAGCIFALIHLQDGLAQSGQRDLLLAVLLLWGYVALFRARRKQHTLMMFFIFGCMMGLAAIIKPVLLPLTASLILASLFVKREKRQYKGTPLCAISGLVLPALCTLVWLGANGSWQAFWTDTLPLIRLHADLGRRSLPFLLAHCMTPVLFLLFPWLILQFSDRPFLTEERIALLLGVLGTAIAYLSQAKGFPYQRYPCLAVLLILFGLDLDRSLKATGFRYFIAAITCLGTCFLFAPRLAWLISTFSDDDPFQRALSEQLLKIDPVGQLDGNVQCIDTFGGCIQTLDQMSLRQSTGFLYDCYLFSDDRPEVQRYRAAFWLAYQTTRPRIVIVTNQFCFGATRSFEKLNRWPTLKSDLDRNYQQKVEWRSAQPQHWWKRWQDPFEFRIYVHR